VEASPPAQKYRCPVPTLQGPDFFKSFTLTSNQTKHVPEDPSLNANCRKACYVSFLINFVDAGEINLSL